MTNGNGVNLSGAAGGAVGLPGSNAGGATSYAKSRTVWPLKAHITPNATAFLDARYYNGYPNSAGVPQNPQLKGYWHTGVDYNGGTGGNTDLGDPLYAIRDGVIEWAGVGSGTWGNVLVVRHTAPNGVTFWARYGHWQTTGKSGASVTYPKAGTVVKAGQVLMFIGRGAQNQFTAHLHFDIIHTKPPRWDWWPARYGNQASVTQYFRDPDAFLRSLGAVEPG